MLLAFQWLQERKEKKKAQARAALGVRKSPRSHSVKVFYGESTALGEEKKTSASTGSPKKKAAKLHSPPKKAEKLASPPKKAKLGSPLKKRKVLCRLILY